MALKATLASLDGLDDATKAMYKQADGKWVLDVEGGVVGKEKLEEFRSTNTQLLKKVETLETAMKGFEGIDPLKYKEFMDKLQSSDEQKLIKDGKLEEVIKLRITKMEEAHTQQLQALTKKWEAEKVAREESQKDRDTYIIDNELRKATDNPDLGFQPGVADILQARVRGEFVYKDGKVIRVKKDGSVVFGADGITPATINEYLAEVAKSSPYLVKASQGGGANNNGGGGGGNQKQIKRAAFNALDATSQSKSMKDGVIVVD